MGIDTFIASKCTQPIVYWGGPVNNGEGGFTYDDPVEILGRWEELNEVIMANDGKEIISQARVFLTQDVDEEGRLWLGELTELDSAPDPNDSAVAALYVVATSRLPKLGSATMDTYKAHLNMTGRRAV